MENLQRLIKSGKDQMTFHIWKKGENHFVNRLILFLGLLNVLLLIVALVLGLKCAHAKEASVQMSLASESPLSIELSNLLSNYSDVIKAKEEAKTALESAIIKHAQMKEEIEQQKIINVGYRKQFEVLKKEKMNLQSNVSALGTSCGICPSGWTLFNTSCYFFSYTESQSTKKNWYDSRADCVRRGSDLVVIENDQEQIFLSHTIYFMKTKSVVWHNGFWIGLTDLQHEGTWLWINNVKEVETKYWMEGEPNNGGNGENCGVAVSSTFSPFQTRYDGHCDIGSLHWICEMKFNGKDETEKTPTIS